MEKGSNHSVAARKKMSKTLCKFCHRNTDTYGAKTRDKLKGRGLPYYLFEIK